MFGTKTKTVTEFIPVPSYGRASDLWKDVAYLAEVKNISSHRVWITEVTEAVRLLRDKADKATTPDELTGYREALDIVKKLILLNVVAKAKIERIEYERVLKEQTDDTIQS